jgi:glycosyltransferase involved in cell wall biosynthesis
MKLVSIIIPTFNRAKLLERAIKSVLGQSYKAIEIVIIDNHSTDNTDEVVNKFNSEKIIYLKIHNYGSIAASRNYGIQNSTGEYIAFLDSDDWWQLNKLEKCIRQLDKHDFVYHNMKKVSKTSISRVWLRALKKPFANDLIINGNAIMTSSVVAKKNILINAGLFNTGDDYRGWEDYDLWVRIAEKPCSFKRLVSFYGYYHLGDDNFDNPTQALKNIDLIEKNLIKEKNYDLSNIWWIDYSRGKLLFLMNNYNRANLLLRKAWRHTGLTLLVRLKILYLLLVIILRNK